MLMTAWKRDLSNVWEHIYTATHTSCITPQLNRGVYKLKTGSFYIKNSPLRGHKLTGDE